MGQLTGCIHLYLRINVGWARPAKLVRIFVIINTTNWVDEGTEGGAKRGEGGGSG